LSLDTTIRPAHVEKEILLRDGQPAIYSRHIVSGGTGPMTFGHHAMVKFRSPGIISTSPFAYGQVYPVEFEDPALGGRTSLAIGARFDDLSKVPTKDGQTADLTHYPAREGFEDLAIIYSKPGCFAWNAVCFPEEGYCWFSLRDPRVLTGTIFWISNGGRPYAPWNRRHLGVMGIEDVTAAMHGSLAGSVADNEASREGFKTYIELDPKNPTTISTIMGVAAIPDGFEKVEDIRPAESGIELVGKTGVVKVPVELGWLNP
jgi:hypothetical protein